MAAVTNTFQTYNAVGIREDLSDLISNISPTDVPFTNAIGKSKADQTKFEWQTDALDTVNASNAQVEGDDVTSYDATTPTVRVSNYTQISRKTLIISGTEEIVTKAGRKSELAYQLVKRTKALKRDMEAIITSNQASVAGTSTTARVTGGLRAWIATNSNLGATGANGGFSAGTVAAATDGTQRAVQESFVKDVVKKCFDAGGEPSMLMVGTFNKQAISGFTGNQTRMQDTKGGTLATAIDIYKHDFGELRIVPNRFQRARDAFVLETNKWKLAYLRPLAVKELATTGDAQKRMLIAEYGLQSMNEAASGVVADLTTA